MLNVMDDILFFRLTQLAIGFATGMGLMVSFYCGAKLSGSHVNPVVTLGITLICYLII